MSEFRTGPQAFPIEALGVGSRAQFIVRTYNHLFGAALQLFASVALLFWYLLRLFSSRK